MLRIRLVGELRLDLDGRRLETIASRRARSLLAWLAYHPGLHPRVSSVFWPDVLDSSARASLRTTLATLRRELGEAGEARADGATVLAGRCPEDDIVAFAPFTEALRQVTGSAAPSPSG
jgi:DNA-binding SARP family transcriptional activator